MKIGFDLAQASGSMTGCGWYAHTLLDALAQVAPDRDFLGYRHFGEWINAPEALATLPAKKNVSDPFGGSPTEAVGLLWRNAIARQMAPEEPNLVHSTSFQAPRFRNSKLVMTVFDLSFWTVPQFTTDQIRLNCQKGMLDALENADGLLFISEHARQEFDHLLPTYRRKREILTEVTPLASRWDPSPTVPGTHGDYWLFVGSLEPRKNLLILLDAYEAYAGHEAKAKPLWLAGAKGWKNEDIQTRISSLEKRNLVRFLGYVDDQKLLDLYRHAHALIFPSWYEGFGLPVLEAMGQGCPVICSDRASLPETAGKAAHYIDPSSPADISAGMTRLHHDRSYRQALAELGLVRARHFSWAQTAKQTLAFYDRVISTA